MTYDAMRASGQGRDPFWLYEITYGSTVQRYAMFGKKDDVSWDGQTWARAKVSHSQIVDSSDITDQQVDISMPGSDSFAQDIAETFGYIQTNVRIFHGFLNDPDGEAAQKFDGRIIFTKRPRGEIILVCESYETSRRHKAIPFHYSGGCAHLVYSSPPGGIAGCHLDIADFQTAMTVTAISGNILTIPLADDADDSIYAGGILTYAGFEQTIRSNVGDQVVLMGGLPGLEDQISGSGSAGVLLAPGCTGRRECCIGVFDNVLNFLGADQRPDETPWQFSVV